MHKEYQTSIYPRGGKGKSARWEWVVYDFDGITPLESGEVIGAYQRAKDAASRAAFSCYLDRRNPKTPDV